MFRVWGTTEVRLKSCLKSDGTISQTGLQSADSKICDYSLQIGTPSPQTGIFRTWGATYIYNIIYVIEYNIYIML